jgi:hypothetical protein
MKKTGIIFVGIVSVLSASFVATELKADTCYRTYGMNNRAVQISACENSTGNSGYLKVKNLTSHPVRVCWSTFFRSKYKEDKRCSNFKPYEETEGSCYGCNRGTSGVTDIEFTFFEWRD